MTGLLYTVFSAYGVMHGNFIANEMMISGVWRIFIFTVLAPIGAIAIELRLPDPSLKKNFNHAIFEKS
ncbi:MAG TPA: hypothetical protein VHP30_11135 [Ignavibacteriales bacterium]|nr:hypothetical protein [Ignavibacteriales bacterium]